MLLTRCPSQSPSSAETSFSSLSSISDWNSNVSTKIECLILLLSTVIAVTSLNCYSIFVTMSLSIPKKLVLPNSKCTFKNILPSLLFWCIKTIRQMNLFISTRSSTKDSCSGVYDPVGDNIHYMSKINNIIFYSLAPKVPDPTKNTSITPTTLMRSHTHTCLTPFLLPPSPLYWCVVCCKFQRKKNLHKPWELHIWAYCWWCGESICLGFRFVESSWKEKKSNVEKFSSVMLGMRGCLQTILYSRVSIGSFIVPLILIG